MKSLVHYLRIAFVYISFIIYYALTWWRLGETLYSDDGNAYHSFKEEDIKIGGGITSTTFIVVMILLLLLKIRVKYDWCEKLFESTWCNLPILVFIIFTIAPAGMNLHYQYKKFNPQYAPATVTNSNATTTNHCLEIRICTFDYILLQLSVVLLSINYFIFPYPKRRFRTGEIFAVSLEFLDAFDMLDLITDTGCVQTYEEGFQLIYYISLTVTALLLAFPISMEAKGKKIRWIRIVIYSFTFLFTDVCFSIIRIKVMYSEQDVFHGFHFLMKNILAAVFRFWFIVATWRHPNDDNE
ncbi:uncharacterized protein LOC130662810 isoform X1 [Hydractinia symbiolongicarpus]|uniref:uncharacterized protein LOC130662810 isoform X1 n=1 Tax=Hydractinia symbiolongicarpus TaxID=13093 RepID=UPI00254CDAD3|nr:uncharacterized protein LOC130662810 isoform X1 [Hydractinia symbiolongicarpus]